MSTLLLDLRYAFRTLRKSPLFTAVAVVTLGLGIGVNTTVFSVVDAIMLRDLPGIQSEGLVVLREVKGAHGPFNDGVSWPDFRDWQAAAPGVEGLAAYHDRRVVLAGAGGEPEQVEVEAVTPNLFTLLRARPHRGRIFGPGDAEAPVVILSHREWERRFERDPRVVGSAVSIDGRPHTVVGIMPEHFGFPDNQGFWVPIRGNEERGWHYLRTLGRLRPGVTREQVQAQMTAVARDLTRRYPESSDGTAVQALDFRKAWSGPVGPVLLVMMGAVAFVLLIACANVANLFLARAAARRKEVAVRLAMGASRGRLVRQLLTESVVLALAGGALGILLAKWGLATILGAFPFDPPTWMVLDLDARVLGFTLLVSLATGMLFGLAPALRATRGDLQSTLRDGARGNTGAAGTTRLRSALVVSELALASVLLVGAMLMIRSFLALQGTTPGFDPGGLFTARVITGGPRYEEEAPRAAFFGQVLEGARTLAGAQDAALASGVPLSGWSQSSGLNIEGQTAAPDERRDAEVRAISASYFSVLGVRLVRGRGFTEQEVADRSPVVVVNRTLAERYWPGEEALGRRINLGGEWLTVVGVSPDLRLKRLNESADEQAYLPYTTQPGEAFTLLVRTAGAPASLAPAVRGMVRELDPGVPVAEVASMEEVAQRSLWQQRLFGGMFTAFGAIALLLAITGVYAMMAYSVGQRVHEIGVRMALGARTGAVLAMVLRDGLRIAGVGLAIGLGAAFGVTRVMKGILWGVSPTDPPTFFGIATLLGGVVLLASYLPARRAARVDPMVALRSE